jgi:hypothetical protein
MLSSGAAVFGHHWQFASNWSPKTKKKKNDFHLSSCVRPDWPVAMSWISGAAAREAGCGGRIGYSVRSATAVLDRAAQLAGSSAPSAAMTSPAVASRASSPGL